MIKLNYGQIRDPEFNPILNEIVKAKMPIATARRILGVMKLIQAEQTASDELWKVVCEQYMVPVEGDEEKVMIDPAKSSDALKALEDFIATPVEINAVPLTEDELSHVTLSPLQLAKLGGLVEGT